MADYGTTQGMLDLTAALRKRLITNGYALNDQQLLTLAIDVMKVIMTNSANITTHATSELASNKTRPFIRGV
jgi:hypothetical protein